MRIIIAYIPVMHQGYEKFLNETSDNSECFFLIGEDIVFQFPELDYISRKDCIRAIRPENMRIMIKSLSILKDVKILNLRTMERLGKDNLEVIMPDEDISRLIAEKYFKKSRVCFKSVFLRWHSNNVEKKNKIPASRMLDVSSFNRKVMGKALEVGSKSWDWWRQVGAVIIKNKELVLMTCNTHMLHPQLPYSLGDPRSIFKKGINIGLSTSEHAEAMLIAEAAKKGIALEGAEIYVSDFPCPPCAKMIARAGLKRCYFFKGYGVLDGEEILKKFNVEIVRINPSVDN